MHRLFRSSLRSKIKNPFNYLYNHTSKYDQKMRALSCKIFNEYYIPELDKKDLDYGPANYSVQMWTKKWFSDFRVVERHQDLPMDLDNDRGTHYYPAHPQIRQLTHVLRNYGLFRDEHRDFNEEMKKKDIARGKNTTRRTAKKNS